MTKTGFNFDDYLNKKLQDPKYKAGFKRARTKLRKEIRKVRRNAGKETRVPNEVRRAYSKIRSAQAALGYMTVSCNFWWVRNLPIKYGGKTPQKLWQEGNKNFVMFLLGLAVEE